MSIDLIEALKIYNVEYLFTDISRSFLNEAQERFEKYPWVKFGLYDINIDYWKQDIPTSYFDVILCNNVLHNANNEVKVLGQFKEIAAPNGNLIIIDATGNNYALMTSIEFLNGLNGVEDFRAENEQIFLQQDQWNKLFKKSDIELLAAFPEEDSTLKVIGQTVFVCKFNSKRRRIDPSEIKNYMANNLPEYMLPSHIEVLKEFPLTANGKIDRNILRNHLDGTLTQTTEQGEAPSTDLEKAIAQIWCDALKKEKIWKNENFYEIGGDSLLVAQVVAKMKEKIEEAKAWDWDKLMIALIESPTIEGISSQEYEYVNRLAENVKRKLENKREESKTWYRIWLEIETVTEKKNYGYEALDSYKINGRIAAFCAEALCSGICQKGIYWPFEILDAEIVMNSLINEEILIGLKENDKKMQEHDLNYEEGEL